MRLIRLTTEENDGRFDCDFNEDLVIPPNSQIALHSFTTQFPSESIVIDSTNNVIRYSVDEDEGDNIKTVVLPQGTYTNANIQDFYSETQRILNRTFNYVEKQVGKQWRAGIFSGKAQFTVRQGVFSRTIGLRLSKNVADVTDTPGAIGGRYQRLGGTIATNDAFIYDNKPICKGSGFFSQKLLVDSTLPIYTGFILGLSSVSPTVNTLSISPTDLKYGIRFNGVGLPYIEIRDGVSTETTVLGQLNDTVIFTYELGVMTYNVTRSDNTRLTLITSDFNHSLDYFPLTIFNGDCILTPSYWIRDPFYGSTTESVEDTEGLVDVGLNTPLRPFTPQFVLSNNFFEFESLQLARAFGYANPRMPQVGFTPAVDIAYTATNPFILRDYSDTYIVELLNIQLNSMDAFTKQHKNYLAVVPHIQELRELVVYVAPILIFLDLNNKFPLSYRQIKARILRDDGTNVTTYGLSQMAILIKSPDE